MAVARLNAPVLADAKALVRPQNGHSIPVKVRKPQNDILDEPNSNRNRRAPGKSNNSVKAIINRQILIFFRAIC